MSHQTTHTDDGYLNDFHREWNERVLAYRASRQSMRFTAEQARAQSLRMKELVRQEEERLRNERRKR